MNEMPSVFSMREPVAAKEHRCCECSTAIAVGEKHVYIAGLWDGDWQTHRRCAPCHELAVAAQCESGCWSERGAVVHGSDRVARDGRHEGSGWGSMGCGSAWRVYETPAVRGNSGWST